MTLLQLLKQVEIQNPDVKDFFINDMHVFVDWYKDKIEVENKDGNKIDVESTIVDSYEIYPTFEFDSAIKIKIKEIVWR